MAETLNTQPADGAQVLENSLDETRQTPPDGSSAELPGQFPVEGALVQTGGEAGEAHPDEQNEAARYTDTELLGKSFRVRRAVQETGTQTIKAWEGMKAKVRNTLAEPGKAIRQFAFNRAKNSFNRKQDRLQATKSMRLQDHRQGVVTRAKERMDRRADSLKQHVGGMEARTRAVTEHEQQRRQEYINELKSLKENALARKAVRAQLRQEGASRRETRSILAEIPAEHIRRVGTVAINVEASRHKLAEATGAQAKATRHLERADNRVAVTEGRIEDFDRSIKEADAAAVELSTTLLPLARGRVENLQDKLDGLEADSPDHVDIAAALEQAKKDVAAYDEQLQNWRATAKNIRAKSSRADSRLGDLYDRQEAQGANVTTAGEQVVMNRKSNLAHSAQLKQTIDAVLTTSEAGKED